MKFAVLFGITVVTASLILVTTRASAQTAAGPAPRVATTLPAAELKALEKERRAVWVDWFTGDTTALRRALGPELVAMSTGAKYWQSLDESVESSAKYKADGNVFVSVEFDSTKVHRFGETVVMFSRYHVVTSKDGTRGDLRGRATEVFVRVGKRWVHTSWHLDAAE
ncbi:MAG: nuclear transport factor 2 family protein [Gemmatimonadaceae bacterium]|nr:nuclear transport factor 2 family protein [Gemmatimonadaceae bacterium]